MSHDFLRDMQGQRPKLHEFLRPDAKGDLPSLEDTQVRVLAEEIKWCLDNTKIKIEFIPAEVKAHLKLVWEAPYRTTQVGKGLISTFYLRHDVYEKYWGKR